VIAADLFHPVEGAVLDLESLHALAGMGSRVWDISLRRAGHGALILHGLELEGEWAPSGPPATVRPEDVILVVPSSSIIILCRPPCRPSSSL